MLIYFQYCRVWGGILFSVRIYLQYFFNQLAPTFKSSNLDPLPPILTHPTSLSPTFTLTLTHPVYSNDPAHPHTLTPSPTHPLTGALQPGGARHAFRGHGHAAGRHRRLPVGSRGRRADRQGMKLSLRLLNFHRAFYGYGVFGDQLAVLMG